MKIADFFVALGVDADQKELNDFTKGIKNLDKTLNQLKLVAIAYAMDRFTRATVNSTVAISNFQNQTGLMAEGLRNWQLGAQLADISLSADAVSSSVSNLQQNLTQISMGGGNVSPFQLLGIDVSGKNAFNVLEDVRNSIKGLSNAKATNLIQQMGLSPQFINVLRLSREEFEKLYSDKTVLSPKKMKAVIDMGTAFTNFKLVLISFKDQIVAFISPALTAFADGLAYVAQGMTTFLSSLSFGDRGVKAFINGLVVLMAMIMPLTALFVGIALVVQDFVTYLNGGDSVIGRMVESVKSLGNAIKDYVLDKFEALMGYIDGVIGKFDELKNYGSGLIDSAGDAVGGLVDGIASGASSVASSLSNTFDNTFNINSNADGNSIAGNVMDKQQNQLNYTMNELNNGTAN